jgi:crossover junction endodeoxyribonuclease RuvC
MLLRSISIGAKPKYFDATDALAVAICHHYSKYRPAVKTTTTKKKKSSWEKFIGQNPDRVL